MSLWSPFGRLPSVADARLNGLPPLDISIPGWQVGPALEPVLWSDLFGELDSLPMTRAGAMRIPAVARARHLIAGTIARLPLIALRGDVELDRAATPSWLYMTDGQLGRYATERRLGLTGGQSPWSRMLWTLDDHLFYGGSLWLITSRSAADGRPDRMVRIPFDAWYLDDTGAYVDADARPLPVELADLVYLPGPHEGILAYGDATLRQAGAMEAAASDVARHPFRLELHQTTETPIEPEVVRDMVAAARRAMTENGGVLFTNAAIETKDHQVSSGDLLIAGRNQTALDVARLASMPATMLDAVATGASLTYETALSRNQQWIDYGLAMYLDAVTARLSMDDVIAQGVRVAFDTASLTALPPPPGPALED